MYMCVYTTGHILMAVCIQTYTRECSAGSAVCSTDTEVILSELQ